MAEYISFQPSDFFNPKLYTGTGAELAITGVGFQPDFVWNKERSGTEGQNWTDSVRGATKYIMSNNDDTESTNVQSLKSFDSDGFTLGTFDGMNTNTETYASWNWKAGTTSGITGGTITPSSYSINTTSGFGIYAYAGTGSAGTIAHGLGVAPKFMVIKSLSENNTDFVTWISPMAVNEYMYMNSLASKTSDTDFMNSILPSSTLISLGNKANVNGSGETFIAYVFAEKKGFSKMGQYTGNASTDGAFVYTGFRPAYVLAKGTPGSYNWNVFDNKRPAYNPADPPLWANSSAAQVDPYPIDLLSNGFKGKTVSSQVNSALNYAYVAFAEFPIVSSNDVPGVAR